MILRLALVDSAAQMGGVEFSTLYFTQRLNRELFLPVVICPKEGDLPERCRRLGIQVVIMSQPRLFSTTLVLGRHYIPNPLAWLVNIVIFMFIALRLANYFQQKAIDVVCTKGIFAHFYGGLAAFWSRTPCVWHVQDVVSSRAGATYPAILGIAGRLLAKQIIADGTPIVEQLIPYYPSSRVSLIYNGVDLDSFSPQVNGLSVRDQWRIDKSEFVIGHVARFTRWKGQHYLILAFAVIAKEFPLAKLVLVGAPVFDSVDYEVELRNLVRQYSLENRVIFAGYRLDLPAVLAAFDLFVHTSIEKDTSPLALVSAMAAGKAIVSTNVPGVAELFPTRLEGILVPPADTAALSVSLRKLLNAPVLCQNLGRAARNQAERALSLDQFARSLENVLARTLDF